MLNYYHLQSHLQKYSQNCIPITKKYLQMSGEIVISKSIQKSTAWLKYKNRNNF